MQQEGVHLSGDCTDCFVVFNNFAVQSWSESMEEQQDMLLISTELAASAWPDVHIGIDSLVPCSNPVCITRHSLSNRSAVKANFSFSDLL